MRTPTVILSLCLFALCGLTQAQAQSTDNTAQVDTLYLSVTGMSCQKGCADGLDASFNKTKGVVYSKTSFDNSSSVIAYNPAVTTDKKLIKIIEKRGFKTSVKKTEEN